VAMVMDTRVNPVVLTLIVIGGAVAAVTMDTGTALQIQTAATVTANKVAAMPSLQLGIDQLKQAALETLRRKKTPCSTDQQLPTFPLATLE